MKGETKSFYGMKGDKQYNMFIDYPEKPPDAAYKYLGNYHVHNVRLKGKKPN